MSIAWLDKAVADAKAKLTHPGAPTEGQLTELVHMLEALGVTRLGQAWPIANSGIFAATLASGPIATVESAVAEIRSELAEVFKAFEARQVAAVDALRAEVEKIRAEIAPAADLFAGLKGLQAAAANPAAPAPGQA